MSYVEAWRGSFSPGEPQRYNCTGGIDKAMTTDGVYKVVLGYMRQIELGDIEGMGAHALRATAGTNALANNADIAKVQEWFGIRIAGAYDRAPRVSGHYGGVNFVSITWRAVRRQGRQLLPTQAAAIEEGDDRRRGDPSPSLVLLAGLIPSTPLRPEGAVAHERNG